MSDINVQSFSGKVKVSNDLTVTTNVHADYFKGDGSLLTNLPSGSGGVWNTNSDNEIYFISSNVGISNADPGHNLSVGSNLYVDDDGSNVLVVTGNVKADHFVGDGSLLTGLSGSGGVWSTNAANEIYFINNNVGISNADPGHNLSVGSNLYVDDDGLDVLVVTGNVNATYLKGNGSLLTNLPSGSGGVWSTNADNEIYFISSNVGISNSNPGHNLSVGSNLYVDDDGSNVLVVDGNIAAESIVIGGISIVPSYPLSLVTETGNITPHTIQFTNATTGLVVSSNIVVTGNVTAAYLHGDASNVTAVPATQITGTLDAARIPALDTAKITTGTLDAARIPALDTAKITTGTLAVANGGTGVTGSTGTGDVVLSDAPTFTGTPALSSAASITGTSDGLMSVQNTTTPAIARMLTTGGQVYFQSGIAATSDSRADTNFTSMYNGTNYLKIQGSTGNVGIGLTNPSKMLHTKGEVVVGTDGENYQTQKGSLYFIRGAGRAGTGFGDRHHYISTRTDGSGNGGGGNNMIFHVDDGTSVNGTSHATPLKLTGDGGVEIGGWKTKTWSGNMAGSGANTNINIIDMVSSGTSGQRGEITGELTVMVHRGGGNQQVAYYKVWLNQSKWGSTWYGSNVVLSSSQTGWAGITSVALTGGSGTDNNIGVRIIGNTNTTGQYYIKFEGPIYVPT
tara:strand:- start:43 stop:2085 length:2043 start_codon:yes stop_codon:yes gene_type:complete